MTRYAKYSALLMAFIVTAHGIAADMDPLSPEQAAHWVRQTVPLPKQIVIRGLVQEDSDEVDITLKGTSHRLAGRAVTELREAISGSEQVEVRSPHFTIHMQVGGPQADPLRDHPNTDQAYRIISNADRDELRLVACTAQGLYNASKTLQQLIEARTQRGRVTIPIVQVTDWPDMAVRGQWGANTYRHIPWLSERKYNHLEQIARSKVSPDKQPITFLPGGKKRILDEGPLYGVDPVPAIVHLEHMGHHGIFDVYPDLQAKGENAAPGAACYSNPKIVDLLAGWIKGHASLPNVNTVDLWLTENLGKKTGCQCDKCKQGNRDLLEVRAVVAAWKRARKEHPDLNLWILTSEETKDSNKKILETIPPEINVWYYHSLLTYNTNSAPIVPSFLVNAVRGGRRAGVCFNLCSTVFHPQPFTGAHFVHARINELVDKGIPAFFGYPKPSLDCVDFNSEAAAEWSWNAKGRSTHEFAYSFAVRRGFRDPQLFAEWSETLGPVAWDVYGSHWPTDEHRNALKPAAVELKTAKLPKLGVVRYGVFPKPWGDIKTASQLNRDVARADRALVMARNLGIEHYLQETLVVQGYIQSLKALWELKRVVTADGIVRSNRSRARFWFKTYIDGLSQAARALGAWEKALPKMGPQSTSYTRKTVKLLDKMIGEMRDVAAELKIPL